jgi:protein O-GlcNAc transferase
MNKLLPFLFCILFISFLSACSLSRTANISAKDNAKTQESLKHYAEAVKLYSQAVVDNPKDSESFTSRGHCQYHLNNYKGAIQDFDKAISLNSADGKAYDLKGLCEYRLKDYKAAIKDFEKALTLDNKNAHTHEDLGDCYKQVGDTSKAKSHLQKAEELYKELGSSVDIKRVQKILSTI